MIMKAIKLASIILLLQSILFAQTDPWNQLNIETPSARTYPTLVEIGGSFYLYGGDSQNKAPGSLRNSEKNILNDLWVYTEGVNWELKNPTGETPQGRRYHAATEKDGKMYIFGGEIEAGTTTDCWEYDPESNTWLQLPFSEENPKHFHRATAGTDKIWITGGLDLTTGSATGAIWGYDPITQLWNQGTDCPAPRFGHIAYYDDGKVVVSAGRQGDNLLDDTWEYNVATNTWTQISDPPFPKAVKFAAYDKNEDVVYIFGGYVIINGNYVVHQSVYEKGLNTNAWSNKTDGPAFTDSQARFFSTNKSTNAEGYKVLVYGIADDGNGSYTGETWVYTSDDDPLTGLLDNTPNESSKVYPNITSGKIQISSESNIHEIEVYDLYGKLIQYHKPNNPEYKLDIAENPNGVYFIKLKHQKNYSTHKVFLTP
jgi:hypothetical protein